MTACERSLGAIGCNSKLGRLCFMLLLAVCVCVSVVSVNTACSCSARIYIVVVSILVASEVSSMSSTKRSVTWSLWKSGLR